MARPPPSLAAADFAPATRKDWLRLVDKTLGGASFEDRLVHHTVDGLRIEPLYTAGVGVAQHERPTRGPRDPHRPWDLRASTAHPDPARANAELFQDLEGGAASVMVRIDPTGADGVAVGSAVELARVLDGVVIELAPVALDAGFWGAKAADWLGAVAKASPSAALAFHLDPFGALAEAGRSPGPIEAHLIACASVGARLADTYPKAGLFLASGRVVHEAGGGEALELGFMAASALAYAKALTRASAPVGDVFPRITLGLAADGDYFLTIAKLRAARLLWGRLTASCGAECPARIEARSSRRMLARPDPWTNMVRLTTAGFGAAVGGAGAVVLGAFTDPIGLPTAFARRQSRNIQLVLMEEANLGRTDDPAGGCWSVEAMTDGLARAGWAAFQAIEAQGGAAAALTSGWVAARVAETLAACRAEIASGQAAIVGVTAFADATQQLVEVEQVDRTAFAVQAPSPRLPGPDTAAPPLTPIRLAEPFEAGGA
jgi:methylmalonyl-CoA mutase